MTSLPSVNGPSVTESLFLLDRILKPSDVGLSPAVSFRIPFFMLSPTNWPIASFNACGMASLRELSKCLIIIRYFMVRFLQYLWWRRVLLYLDVERGSVESTEVSWELGAGSWELGAGSWELKGVTLSVAKGPGP